MLGYRKVKNLQNLNKKTIIMSEYSDQKIEINYINQYISFKNLIKY